MRVTLFPLTSASIFEGGHTAVIVIEADAVSSPSLTVHVYVVVCVTVATGLDVLAPVIPADGDHEYV